jgi:nucleotide-binding universal stress UspA family protein
MASRILVIYDGSVSTRKAVEHALQLSLEVHASLFVLAIRSDPAASPVAVGDRLTKDLIAFAQRGVRMGAEVDASYLDAPTTDLIQQVLLAHGIDRVVIARPEGGDESPATAMMLHALGQGCPVPVTVIG